MAIKIHKPTSPGSRHHVSVRQDFLADKEPEKSLTVTLKKTGGRNTYGRVTARHKGVITSYSIHYTKLYEPWGFREEKRRYAQNGRGKQSVCALSLVVD